MKTKHVVGIVGGGSSAHVLISLLNHTGHEVMLLTRKPEKWQNEIDLQYQDREGNIIKSVTGELSLVSSKEEDIIPDCDVIILCMPVSSYRLALNKIGSHINKDKKTFVGTIYGGQAGFNWMVDEMKTDYGLNKIVTFAYILIPWICRTIEYGKIGVTWGSKDKNVVAVAPADEFDELNETLFKDICENWFNKGENLLAENFISLTMSGDNQLIHTSRCFALYEQSNGKWKNLEDVPYMYRDYDEFSAKITEGVDNDLSSVREAIKAAYPNLQFTYMLDYLALERLSYASENDDILESLTDSSTLGTIKPPLVKEGEYWILDKDHRFFNDDIQFGLCVVKWLAQELNLEVATIDEILHWAQKLKNEEIIDENNKLIENSPDLKKRFVSGIPSQYGYKTIDDIIDVS